MLYNYKEECQAIVQPPPKLNEYLNKNRYKESKLK